MKKTNGENSCIPLYEDIGMELQETSLTQSNYKILKGQYKKNLALILSFWLTPGYILV